MQNRAQRRSSGITFRAIVIGFILIIANAHWLTYASERMSPPFYLTLESLFFNAVMSLFIVLVCNLLAKQFVPRRALSPQELLVIYIMVVMVSTVGGHTLMCFLLATITHPFRFATPENEWAPLFWRYIPSWFTPAQGSLNDYFDGESTLYTMKHFRIWLVPVVVWTTFIGVVWYVLLCINVIIRAQWTEKEMLVYPIIQLPVRMTLGGTSFFKNRLMWSGFAVAGVLELLAGLNYLFPKIPALRLNYYSIRHLFTGRPWDSIGWMALSAFPFIIGILFFVPLDLSLSAWVFFFALKAERIIRIGMLGAGDLHFDERAAGGWLAVGVLAVWGARRHLYQVWQRLWSRDAPIDDTDEPMRYRTATIGLVFGLGFLILFSYKAGMSLWVICGFLAVYLVISLALTRVRAEFGPPAHGMMGSDPGRFLFTMFGSRRIGTPSLTVLSFYYWLNRLYAAHPMPSQLEAFKIAEMAKISNKRLVWVMMFATVVGTLVCFWSYLHIVYRVGASATLGSLIGVGREVFTRLEIRLSNFTGPNYPELRAGGIGIAITYILSFLRHRLLWWPLHPIGYVMATSGIIKELWCSIFLGWLIKAVIMRFFGARAHRRAAPFFLGLILGDYVVSCSWTLIGTVFQFPTYVLWSP